MIKPNEIRLGNMFHPIIKKDWGIEKTYIDHGSIITVGKDRNGVLRIDIDVNNISGIPITEEWLLKAGFKKKYNDSYINNTQYIKVVNSNVVFDGIGSLGGGLVVCAMSIEGDYLCDNLDFVHQLQNLWHSLTGEELEFNL